MRYALVLLIVGCGGSSGTAVGPDGAIVAPDAAVTADAASRLADAPPAISDAPSSLPGTRVTQPAFQGQGACAGKTLGQVITAVQQQMPALADITVIEGMDPNLGGDGNRIYAFAHPDGFRLVFKRGSNDCPGGCIDNEYWYFETDARCAPVLVGHHKRAYASMGNCYQVEGTPMWGRPPPIDPTVTCGADNSPQNITGSYQMIGTGTRIACTEKAAAQPQEKVTLPLTVVVFQMPGDLAKGTVTVMGTGNPRLDLTPIAGTFKRRRVSANQEVTLPSTCLDQRQTTIELDFENGTTGTLKFFEARALTCPPGNDICKGELDLQLTPAN